MTGWPSEWRIHTLRFSTPPNPTNISFTCTRAASFRCASRRAESGSCRRVKTTCWTHGGHPMAPAYSRWVCKQLSAHYKHAKLWPWVSYRVCNEVVAVLLPIRITSTDSRFFNFSRKKRRQCWVATSRPTTSTSLRALVIRRRQSTKCCTNARRPPVTTCRRPLWACTRRHRSQARTATEDCKNGIITSINKIISPSSTIWRRKDLWQALGPRESPPHDKFCVKWLKIFFFVENYSSSLVSFVSFVHLIVSCGIKLKIVIDLD